MDYELNASGEELFYFIVVINDTQEDINYHFNYLDTVDGVRKVGKTVSGGKLGRTPPQEQNRQPFAPSFTQLFYGLRHKNRIEFGYQNLLEVGDVFIPYQWWSYKPTWGDRLLRMNIKTAGPHISSVYDRQDAQRVRVKSKRSNEYYDVLLTDLHNERGNFDDVHYQIFAVLNVDAELRVPKVELTQNPY